MKPKNYLLLLFLTLLLVACGAGAETAAPAAVVEAPTAEIAPLQLDAAVDVHTVADVQNRDDVILIDVREQWEYDEKHIPGVTLIPLGTVPDSLSQIPQDKTVIVTCRSGNRSGQATTFLRQQGFENVHNMEGGIIAWEAAGFEVE